VSSDVLLRGLKGEAEFEQALSKTISFRMTADQGNEGGVAAPLLISTFPGDDRQPPSKGSQSDITQTNTTKIFRVKLCFLRCLLLKISGGLSLSFLLNDFEARSRCLVRHTFLAGYSRLLGGRILLDRGRLHDVTRRVRSIRAES
jgi:hypothetical protein